MEEEIFGMIVGGFAIFALFLGLPWLVFHYITKWKTAATLTTQDEDLLDDLNELARRLDERVVTIERIMDAEHPSWRVGQMPPPQDRQPTSIKEFRR